MDRRRASAARPARCRQHACLRHGRGTGRHQGKLLLALPRSRRIPPSDGRTMVLPNRRPTHGRRQTNFRSTRAAATGPDRVARSSQPIARCANGHARTPRSPQPCHAPTQESTNSCNPASPPSASSCPTPTYVPEHCSTPSSVNTKSAWTTEPAPTHPSDFLALLLDAGQSILDSRPNPCPLTSKRVPNASPTVCKLLESSNAPMAPFDRRSLGNGRAVEGSTLSRANRISPVEDRGTAQL